MTRVGAYENQYPKLFDVGVTFPSGCFLVFCFCQKPENQKEKISKIQKCHTTTRKSRKKSRAALGAFFGRPNPELEKTLAFYVKICLYYRRPITDTPASGLRVALTADGRAGAGAADESPHAIGRHTHRRHRRWEPARGAVSPFRDAHFALYIITSRANSAIFQVRCFPRV